MRRVKRRPFLLAVAALSMLAAPLARAQFYKVYQWETPMTGWVEPSLWNTYVAQSDARFRHFGRDSEQEGLWAHALEVEYGVTERFTLGAYADFVDPPDGDLEYARARVQARYRFFERYQRAFNPAVYFEYIVPSRAYGGSEELEMRFIFERDFEDVRLVLNPILSKATSGDEVDEGVSLNFANGIYYRRYHGFQPGLELFSELGPASNTLAPDEQKHLLFAVGDIRFARNWVWQLGVGTGLTAASDDVVAKSILSYEFQTVRPSRQAR